MSNTFCFRFIILLKLKYLLFLGGFTLLPISCTSKPEVKPSLAKYQEDTNLMLNIANKFLYEPDPKKLHKVAVATQQTRVLGCSNIAGECDLYGKFLSKIIESSSDGNINPTERQELELILAQLKSSIKEGQNKLNGD